MHFGCKAVSFTIWIAEISSPMVDFWQQAVLWFLSRAKRLRLFCFTLSVSWSEYYTVALPWSLNSKLEVIWSDVIITSKILRNDNFCSRSITNNFNVVSKSIRHIWKNRFRFEIEILILPEGLLEHCCWVNVVGHLRSSPLQHVLSRFKTEPSHCSPCPVFESS